jgi:hypothetical protein
MAEYHVGQVLFLVPHGQAAIIPIQVQERRTSEMMNGTVVKHCFKGVDPKSPLKVLETVTDASIFTSVEEIRELMMANASRAIDEIITKAHSSARNAFVVDPGTEPTPTDTQAQAAPKRLSAHELEVAKQALDEFSDGGTSEIMLPDGTRKSVKVNLR